MTGVVGRLTMLHRQLETFSNRRYGTPSAWRGMVQGLLILVAGLVFSMALQHEAGVGVGGLVVAAGAAVGMLVVELVGLGRRHRGAN